MGSLLVLSAFLSALMSQNPLRSANNASTPITTNKFDMNSGMSKLLVYLIANRSLYPPEVDSNRLVVIVRCGDGLDNLLNRVANCSTAPVPDGDYEVTKESYYIDGNVALFLHPWSCTLGGQLPDFTNWIMSRTLYPEQSGSTYGLGVVCREICHVDQIRYFLGFLTGAINVSFRMSASSEASASPLASASESASESASMSHARMVAMILDSTRNHLQYQCGNREPTEEVARVFRARLERAGNSVSTARDYLGLVKQLSPREYYRYLLTTSVTDPALLSSSVFPSVTEFVAGLLIDTEITFSGVAESVLRMVVERSARALNQVNIANILDREELITLMITTGNKYMISNMRYCLRYSRAVEALAKISRVFTVDDVMSCLHEVNARVDAVGDDVVALALAYLGESAITHTQMRETLAEIILTCMGCPRGVLGFEGFVCRVKTDTIDNTIVANHRVIQERTEARQRMESARAELEAARNGNVVASPLRSDAEVVTLDQLVRLAHNCARRTNIIDMLISLVLVGVSAIPAIEYFLNVFKTSSGMIAHRNVRKWLGHIIYIHVKDDAVKSLFLSTFCSDWTHVPQLPRRNFRLLNDLRCTMVPLVHCPAGLFANPTLPSVTVMDLHALLADRLTFAERAAAAATSRSECAICADTRECVRIRHRDGGELHRDTDHLVCRECLSKLESCPFCRAAL